MKILFVHQNFPGQFIHLAPALAADPQHTVVALTMQATPADTWPGIALVRYSAQRGSTPGIHPWLVDLETKAIRGEAALHAACQLRDAGFVPDVIVAHPGWGESLFLKEVWPDARLGIYCEFFYKAQGADVGFDPEFALSQTDAIRGLDSSRAHAGDGAQRHPQTGAPNGLADAAAAARLRLKNVNNLLHFEVADAGLSPTHWQASTFASPFRQRITVVHDGIDTDAIAPNPGVRMRLGDGLELGRDDEVITFVNRNLEPYRGYHIFMRALPALLRRHPHARVLLVGADGVSYGARAPDGQTWKGIFAAEARAQMTDAQWARVHFLGHVPHATFVGLLQLSTVHVYLTYPFVLSWSLLEAMSAGCAIVASDTQPLHEAITDGQTGRLVGFFDVQALTDTVSELLADPDARALLSGRARAFAQENYDLHRVCLPRQLKWVQALAASATLPASAS